MDVTDVAVKTTREREDTEVADTKKRKMCDNNGDLMIPPDVASSVVRSNSDDVSVAPASELISSKLDNNMTSTTALSEPAVSSNCDIDEALTSCCESNGSSDSIFVDLDDCLEIATKENNSEFEESGETIFSIDLVNVELQEVESTPKRPHVSPPSEAELDEFFAAAEKDLLDRFAHKYNFDFTKEKPLEGFYEWVQL